MGRYVSMNSGNVKVKATFFHAGAWMRRHSLATVMPPSTSRVDRMLPMHSSRDRMANHTPSPCSRPSTDRVRLASRPSAVRINAGRMDMDMSKQLQLPLAVPFSSSAP